MQSTVTKTATSEIKNNLRLLNLLISFVIFLFLFVIVRYLEGPLKKFLDFLPDMSMVLVIIVVTLLGGIGLYIARLLSQQVVHRIEDYSERLDNILNITRGIREEIYGDILIDKIMDSALAITKSDAGSILLMDGENLVFKVVKGSKSEDLIGKTIPLNAGVGGWVLKHSNPVLIKDVRKDERFDPTIDETTGYQTSSMLCTPLKTSSATIGVIELMNKKQGFYDERDLEVIGYLADHAAISLERARFYEDQRNYEIYLTDILLDTIDRFIPEKRGHSKRVAKYANIIAKALGLHEQRKRRLYFASLLHDIGFLRLSSESFFDKKTYLAHPEIGYEMLEPINFYKDIAPYVLHHHERYDGLGYPQKLKGVDIPLESRIIAIAEAFDSMVSSISYRISISFDDAIRELIRSKAGQFDPELVDLFVKNIKSTVD